MRDSRAGRLPFDLLLITPERAAADIAALTVRALDGEDATRVGVLLRAKHLEASARVALGRVLRARTRDAGATFLVSADLALCDELAADGVQLPEAGARVGEARKRLGAGACIGASRHDLAGVLEAERDGASFATLSPIYATPEKGAPLGVTVLSQTCQRAALPVVALGGIEPENAGATIAAGAAGIAVIRSVFGHPEPAVCVAALLAAIDHARGA